MQYVRPDVSWASSDGLVITDDNLLDEMWDGVLHVNPQPKSRHQRLGADLFYALYPLARARGLFAWYESSLLDFSSEKENYRAPDLMISRPEQTAERGVADRAELVVEILSPRDESRKKFDFYAKLHVREVLLVDPHTRVFELYRLGADGYERVGFDADGAVGLEVVDLRMATTQDDDGNPLLALTTSVGTALI